MTVQIGPVKYNKKEEKTFVSSFLLGLLAGSPLGLLLIYIFGFPQYPSNFGGRFVFSLLLLVSIESISLLISTILSLLFFEKRKLLHSWHDVARVVWCLFVVFPVLWMCVALYMSALIFPLYDVAFWLDPIRKYWLGALAFLPFLGLFTVIFLPETPARKDVHYLWLIFKRKAPVPKLNVRSAIVTLLIFVWLLLIFLPLPNAPSVNLTLIAGGILVVAYFARQRYRRKENRRNHAPAQVLVDKDSF
jgi:hypothetical protein